MEIETKVVSTQIIQPSSPTPKYLQKYQLSFLDQLAPPSLIPIVYFYQSNPKPPNSEQSKQLKKSLSETLSIFYPLAGRLIGNRYVDCNDGGVPLVEAFANCDLSRVITSRETDTMRKKLFHKLDESQGFCLAVQATYFHCGGLALGILISHKIADGLSTLVFANTWSAIAKNGYDSRMPTPKFDGATYFPPGEFPGFNPSVTIEEEEVASKVFIFPAEKIALLTEKYSSAYSGGVNLAAQKRRPSPADTVSAYIWTRFLSIKGTEADPTKTYTIHHAINLRRRVDPPMSEYSFGNINWLSSAKLAVGDDGGEIIRKARESRNAIHDDYAAVLRDKNVLIDLMAEADEGKHISFTFTSFSRFPLYEANFGWGNPVWVVVSGLPVKDVALFTDTKCGGGIEALVHLSKSDMKKFEAHFNLT